MPMPSMIDVGSKEITERSAVAQAIVRAQPDTVRAILSGKIEKGDVLNTSRVAAIQAAKDTSRLLPLCHPIPLSHVEAQIEPNEESGTLTIITKVRAHWKTGVEMEALAAAMAAALCVYDMCKRVDRSMSIQSVELLEKRGGRSGTWKRP